jgi:hypothetical protein
VEVCASNNADQVILACTRLMSNSKISRADLESVYVNRGNAYFHKGAYDRTIADADVDQSALAAEDDASATVASLLNMARSFGRCQQQTGLSAPL